MRFFLFKFKERIRYNIIIEWYNFLSLFGKRQRVIPDILTIEKTITWIMERKASVSRFGDGELLLIGGKPIRFQQSDPKLSDRLIEVLESDLPNHIVCLSDAFIHLDRYNRRARRFWNAHFYLYGYLWDRHLHTGKVYGNTFMTRPYIDYANKSQAEHWFSLIKQLWHGRDIVFVEGEKSRLGVGNDLFDNVGSVQRILCRPTNAFSQYDTILKEVTKLDKEKLVLIALGPTATVLAHDLCLLGYQAIDVGHIDIEYEWFKMGATHKVNIKSKYVNEVVGGDSIVMLEENTYQGQIIKRLV